MRKLRRAGWTYEAIGKKAGMSRQAVFIRTHFKPKTYFGHGIRNWLFSQYRRKARARGYGWRLSLSDFLILISQPCYYCGRPPSNRCLMFTYRVLYNGLDRRDNKQGYHKKNVVPCCGRCNRMKGTLSLWQFRTHISRINKNFS